MGGEMNERMDDPKYMSLQLDMFRFQPFVIFQILGETTIFFPQHMLRVSFSPGRYRACRHCWISSL